MRALALVLVAACGRIGFDARDAGIPCGGAPHVNHRSVGTDTSELFAGLATVAPGSCGLVLASGTVPVRVGAGDRVAIGGDVLYVADRIDDRTLVVDDPPAMAHDNEAVRITRAYATFDAWEAERGGDLVGEDRAEAGVAYADGPFVLSSTVMISGSTTDATHFMRITAAAGQRHHGQIGAGVVLDGQRAACSAFEVLDPFTEIEHLELVRFAPETGCGPAAVIVRALNVTVRALLVHDYGTTATNASSAVRLGNTDVASAVVQNVMAFSGRFGARVPQNALGTMTVENCTFFDMVQSGVQLGTGGASMTVTNTLALGSTGPDFDNSGGTMVQRSNGSTDGTATGITNVAAATTFVSSTGTIDLHLLPGASARGAATDLAPELVDDIDEEPRPTGAWDVGADQR